MNMEPVATWSYADIGLLFIMWAIMMAGMMLPSALPVILLIDKINQQRQQHGASFTPTFFFSIGYLIAWAIYSVLITIIQTWLHHLELLSPMMDSANIQFSALILIVAGIYQFSAFKQQCLNLCRSPLSLLTGDWQEGIKGAVSLGIKHGSYCVGCCWFLMAILFVTGVMNLQWILILTLVVLVEKALPKGEIISKYLGALLILLGLSYLF
ncbi:DUF2182 domain-containing protein [Thalassotalea nanhaiensis]|uniref:DUF2182 domain-containing protein n=1 Tax=Thalassotalea nanhaiensis TaxID=3065648 RepID=A0ABY9TKX8_9GAMM|nr:DUF2182 domain-containing protein [Colwelliaceae bacterium SQ345]